ncbi:CHAT domain-containing protein [Actinocrispum wychmicini]|uniref:CHAT domain-containing protein n=1 Tax=Actinocrispum wychmicini TaxID=1213861 RepID=UPI0014047B71|nr:CHAT domain-containing protein [Actinocrispum wychmicini]
MAGVIETARELYRRAVDASCVGHTDEALRLTKQGIALLDSAEPESGEAKSEWLRARIRLACLLTMETLDETAIEDLRPLIASLPNSLVRAELNGLVDHDHGVMFSSAGRFREAVPYYSSAIARKEECLSGTDEPRMLTESLINSLWTRGWAHMQLGLVEQSRDDFNRALLLSDELGLRSKGANARHGLGGVELRLGNVPAALRWFEDAQAGYYGMGLGMLSLLRVDQAQAMLIAGLADEAGRHLDEVLGAMRAEQVESTFLAEAELFRAAAALHEGEYELANEMAASAGQRMKRRGCEPCTMIAALIGLRIDAESAFRTGTIHASLPTRALRLADKLDRTRFVDYAALARILAARLELHRGRLAKAAALLEASPRPGRLTSTDYRMARRLCRAEVAVAEGNTSKGLAEIRIGLGELDQVRDRMGGLELGSGTALYGRELADLAVRLVIDGADARRLFSWLERTRAQTYRYEPVPGAADQRLAEVSEQNRTLHLSRFEGCPTAAVQTRWLARQRETNRLGLHAGRWGKPRPVAGLGEVIGQLRGRALVSFASSEETLVAVVVVDDKVTMVRLGSTAVAAERARMLNVDINALAPDGLPGTIAQVVAISARKQADLLDAQLMRPLQSLIGDRDIVVVPTGALYAVPWGALPSFHSRPTVVAPSATAWLAADQAQTRRGRTVLVRGPGLPAAVGEIDKLAAHHQTAKLMSDGDATIATVLKALDGAKLAHIAAHGAHEPENALFSRLELADGALFAHEMAGVRRPPQHVVLAACELALNRIRPGDEALGFASALLASGSQTVVAPLSRVGDQASAAAMDDYHRRLAAGVKPAVALADAIAVDPLRRPFVCLGSGHS